MTDSHARVACHLTQWPRLMGANKAAIILSSGLYRPSTDDLLAARFVELTSAFAFRALRELPDARGQCGYASIAGNVVRKLACGQIHGYLIVGRLGVRCGEGSVISDRH